MKKYGVPGGKNIIKQSLKKRDLILVISNTTLYTIGSFRQG